MPWEARYRAVNGARFLSQSFARRGLGEEQTLARYKSLVS
jgi:hypothetical protein